MFRKAWFRFLAWFTAVYFFFVTAMTFACLMAPAPPGEHIEKWLKAMEKTMEISLMGIAMDSGSTDLPRLTYTTIKIIPLFTGLGLLGGILIALGCKVYEKK